MKITSLCEDVSNINDIGQEHGLSMFIQTSKQNVLFDFGASDLFSINAKKLHIDLNSVELCFLSHGHYDHGGGIKAFLAINKFAPIYVSKYAFGSYYALKNDIYKYIGIDKNLENEKQIKIVDKNKKLDTNLTVFDDIGNYFPNASANKVMYVPISKKYTNKDYAISDKDLFINDSFCHEQHLIIAERGITTLIVGCSHKGIVNILESFKHKFGKYPDTVIGGFHLQNPTTKVSEPPEYIEKIADYLISTKCQCYTCHCTGVGVYQILKDKLKDK